MAGYIGDRGFTLYWVCGEHRVPLEIKQIGGGGDSWHVLGGGYCILNLYPDHKGGIYYCGNDYTYEDILALVDVIEQETALSYNNVYIESDPYPSNICRYPPYFNPVFRNKLEKARYYRQKWLLAKKELDL